MVNIGTGIRGITDRPRRAPRLGKIKLGRLVALANGKERPEATSHFVVPEEVAAVYGDEPTSIDIIFPSDDLDIVAPYNLKQYGSGSGLKCKGDGENASALLDIGKLKKYQKATGFDGLPSTRPTEPPPKDLWDAKPDATREWAHIPCFGLGYDGTPACPMIESKACRSVMHLQFILPKVPGVGIWQMDIGSPISIGNMLDQFNFLGQMTGGRIAGLPMRLEIVPIEVAPDGKRREVHVVYLRYDESFDDLRTVPATLLESITGEGPLLIDAPDESDILTTVPETDEVEAAEAEPLDAAPPTLIDDDATVNVNPNVEIPDDVKDLASLLRWANGAHGMQPAETFSILSVENGAKLVEEFGGYREAASQVIVRMRERSVMARFEDSDIPLPEDGAS